jgi:hypothetical protein
MLLPMSRARACGLALMTVGVGSCRPPIPPDILLAPPLCTRDLQSPPHATSELRRAGCLEVSVNAVRRRPVPESSLLLAYGFTNRCLAPARVDFTGVRVTARLADGSEEPLALFDPRGEVHSAVIGSGDWGWETLEYDPPGGTLPASFCVNLAGITDRVDPVSQVCFRRVSHRIANPDH